jgi:3-methyladenine DNA glycosylase Tag
MSDVAIGPDGRPRCGWIGAAPGFLEYHDTEWGFPVADDRRLFEKLCLEGFQAGLSWRTILDKPPQTASMTPASVALSKELKRRGWRFVGATTVYAFMQAMGLVNDHAEDCVIRLEVQRSRAGFQPPGR